jgi:hypothetical protein
VVISWGGNSVATVFQKIVQGSDGQISFQIHAGKQSAVIVICLLVEVASLSDCLEVGHRESDMVDKVIVIEIAGRRETMWSNASANWAAASLCWIQGIALAVPCRNP